MIFAISLHLDQLDPEQLTRAALSRRNLKRLASGLRITSYAVVFLVIVLGIRMTLMNLFGPSEKIEAMKRLVEEGPMSPGIEGLSGDLSKEQLTRKEVRIIRDTKAFGITQTNVVAPTTTDVAPPTPEVPLTLVLIGTFVNANGKSSAIIEDTKKNTQDVFKINDSIFEQATLKKVLANSVEIERNGKTETLLLEDFGTGDSGGGSAPAGAEQVIVDERELNSALDNLPLLLTQARAVPYFKDGQSVGLRLFAIKTGSLYDKIGLKNGDILKNINGKNLGDFSQAMKLFEQLREERNLTLEIERNRQPATYYYTIQ